MYQFGNIYFVLGKNKAMQDIYQLIQKVAPTNATVLLTGETGVGKEVFSRVIHHLSRRWQNNFVVVNCASLPPNLIESELFGHEKGSFTGAETTRIGRFELADKGTLLLDEISEISIRLQGKLLRVLEDRTFERVGSNISKKTDARIVATTNRNLEELVNRKLFRQDLYYRLNVIPIHIPPLRERREDIIPLSQYYITRYSHENGIPLKSFSTDALELLQNYDWPGNVRELFNVIERVTIVSPDQEITAESIKCWLKPAPLSFVSPHHLIGRTLEAMEKEMIRSNLTYFCGNRRRTAESLGIADRTLRNKLRRYPDILMGLKGERNEQGISYSGSLEKV